jgi:DNA modification methylase
MLEKNRLTAETTEDLRSTWKEAPRFWGHSLHRLAPYIGGFPPALAHYFIRRFSEVGETVLDPFCGGGTTPLESALLKRKALGNDSFSYAYTLSTAKCNPLNKNDFEDYLDGKKIAAKSVDNRNLKLLDNDDLKIFYSDYTLDQILRLREVVSEKDSKKAHYLKAIICGILHGPSQIYLSIQTKDTYSGTANYVKKYAENNNLTKPKRNIWPNALRKQDMVLEDWVPPWMSEMTNITQTDARNLKFSNEKADLILTSPPYMQTLDYSWNNWLRLWWLDKDRKKEQNNLDITQDTTKYRDFMRTCLSEMYRILKPDSVAVLVVGDITKHLTNRKETLNVAGYIADEARENTSFDVHGIIDDSYGINSRSYVTFNRLKYDHGEADESKENIDRCLILTKGSPELSHTPDIDWEKELYAVND